MLVSPGVTMWALRVTLLASSGEGEETDLRNGGVTTNKSWSTYPLLGETTDDERGREANATSSKHDSSRSIAGWAIKRTARQQDR